MNVRHSQEFKGPASPVGTDGRTSKGTKLLFAPEPAPDHRALIDHAYILVVDVPTTAGHRTRRATYFSLQAAERAIGRATMRGQTASVILAQIVPVAGDDLG